MRSRVTPLSSEITDNFYELIMNYSYKRPLSNPVKIVVTDKMKRIIKETDKYWEKIELKLNEI